MQMRMVPPSTDPSSETARACQPQQDQNDPTMEGITYTFSTDALRFSSYSTALLCIVDMIGTDLIRVLLLH